jgi:hypothetical protein
VRESNPTRKDGETSSLVDTVGPRPVEPYSATKQLNMKVEEAYRKLKAQKYSAYLFVRFYIWNISTES